MQRTSGQHPTGLKVNVPNMEKLGHTVVHSEGDMMTSNKQGFIVLSCFLLSFIQLSQSQDTCVSFNNTTQCSSSSTWAVNIPSLNVTHKYHVDAIFPFSLKYQLVLGNATVLTLCETLFLSDDTCRDVSGTTCLDCRNDFSSNGSVMSKFFITDVDMAKDKSRLKYDLSNPVRLNLTIQRFDISACQSPENANTFECPTNQCGYDCVCHFNCSKGFYNESLDTSREYRCDVSAAWSPPAPICTAETTTTEPATNPTVPTTSTGSATDTTSTTYSPRFTKPDDHHYYPNSGPVLAGIGGALAVACIVLFVYMICNNIAISNKIILYVMFILCLCVWAIALGLCFGKSNDKSAVIAGIVLGSLALAGMVVIAVFQIMQITSQKRKGIKGKLDESGL